MSNNDLGDKSQLVTTDKSNFVAAINEVAQDSSSANDFGDRVNIVSYSSSNMYTFPSDGYVWIYADGTSAKTTCKILGSTSSAILQLEQNHDDSLTSVFVRKGMRCYCETAGTGTKAAYFYPLV